MVALHEENAAGNLRLFLGGLCFITDRNVSSLAPEQMVAAAVSAGARWVQYRDKGITRRELYLEAMRLRALTKDAGAVFIVNDYPDVALAVEADGVHLGQDDLPIKEARPIMGNRIIGISTHSVAEAVDAEKSGADYIGFGPVFSTMTKDAGEPRGVNMLAEIKRYVRIPVVAIGGITLENAAEVIGAGAHAVAVASGILRGDVYSNVRSFMDVLGAS